MLKAANWCCGAVVERPWCCPSSKQDKTHGAQTGHFALPSCGACCSFRTLQESVRSKLTAQLKAADHGVNKTSPVVQVDEWINAVAGAFAEERAAAIKRCTAHEAPRVAVLMSGGARTITTEEAIADMARFFQWLRGRSAGVRLYAFIGLDSHYHARNPWHAANSGNVTLSAAAVRGALSRFGVPHELRLQGGEHDDADFPSRGWAPSVDPYDHARTPPHATLAPAQVTRALSAMRTQQALKLAAAVRMMENDERRRASTSDVIVWLRPDACVMVGLPFFEFALARTNCASLVRFDLADVAAVAPRSMASVMARQWKFAFRLQALGIRNGGGDVPPTAGTCGGRGLSFDMHHGHLLSGREVQLRRPRTGCSSWN